VPNRRESTAGMPGRAGRSLIVLGLLVGLACAPAWCSRADGPPTTDAHADPQVERLLRSAEEGLRQCDAALGSLRERAQALRGRVAELARKLESIDTAEPRDESDEPAPKGGGPREVKYRPPMREYVDKPSISFLCEEGRVSVLDFDVVKRYVQGLRGEGRINVDGELPGSDFRVKGYVLKQAGKVRDAELTVSRKPGHRGESAAEIQRPGSAFRRAISSPAKRPEDYVVSFSVWPDSYEVFRRARSLAWDAGFDVGWHPRGSGERIQLGYGQRLSEVD
jgi:hypothetical protein